MQTIIIALQLIHYSKPNESNRMNSEKHQWMNTSPDTQSHILLVAYTNYDTLRQKKTFVFTNMDPFVQFISHALWIIKIKVEWNLVVDSKIHLHHFSGSWITVTYLLNTFCIPDHLIQSTYWGLCVFRENWESCFSYCFHIGKTH